MRADQVGDHRGQTEHFERQKLVRNPPQHQPDVAPLLEDRDTEPGLLAEAKKLKVAVDPIPGDKLQEMVAHVLDFPERLVPKAREIVQ